MQAIKGKLKHENELEFVSRDDLRHAQYKTNSKVMKCPLMHLKFLSRISHDTKLTILFAMFISKLCDIHS